MMSSCRAESSKNSDPKHHQLLLLLVYCNRVKSFVALAVLGYMETELSSFKYFVFSRDRLGRISFASYAYRSWFLAQRCLSVGEVACRQGLAV